jgi:hypothetical protein
MSRRFYTRTNDAGTFCSLWFRRSCDASIAQSWLWRNYGLSVSFLHHAGWYKMSWQCITQQHHQLADRLEHHCN